MAGFRLSPTNAPSESGVVGKAFFSLFFLAFLAAGLLFTWLIARDTAAMLNTRSWKPVECEILQSGVEDQPSASGFTLRVSYRYRWEGKAFTSDQFTRKPETFSDYSKAARLAGQYPAGKTATAYVNPSSPSEAILKQGNLWSIFAILFPMVFVAIGAGGVFFVWRKRTPQAEAPQPISDRARTSRPPALSLLFWGFLVVGVIVFYAVFVRTALKIVAARGWREVPCVIISSEVKSHRSDDGTTYSVNIYYRYEINGREHRSNKYKFMGGSSSGYDRKRAVVNRYPPGAERVCYVNPDDPTEAVLERRFTPDVWLGALPLLFVIIGAVGLVKTRRQHGASPSVDTARPPDCVPLPAVTSGTVTLKPSTGRWGKLIGSILIAAFWNGIVSVFVVHLVNRWRAGAPEWFPTIFMIPFVLVGLGLFVAVGYFLLALFNPAVTLRMTPGSGRLGESLQVQWQFTGRTLALRRVRLWLEGREEATYRRGTDTITDRNVFAAIEIAEHALHPDMVHGSKTVAIPPGLMHSFVSANNKIVWTLHVKGEISIWPDVSEEFPITVLPLSRPPAP